MTPEPQKPPPPARRVLLVDDEPRIVAGLQRLFRPHRAEWDVSIATSGHDALDLMALQTFDVIVSDMRMPQMDGATLLTIAKEKYPATMRVVLSGQTDAEATFRVLPIAHQFLSKPIPSNVLLETLKRVVKMQTEIRDVRVRAAIGAIGVLPTLPSVCQELTRLLADPETASIEQIGVIVERDPAIVAKLLQLVNSAFFGAGHEITSVSKAVTYLGTEQLKNLVFAIAIASAFPPRAKTWSAFEFQAHALTIARLAARIATAAEDEQPDSAFSAGLLHDIGKLVMASAMPDLFDQIVNRSTETKASFEDVEREMGCVGHAKIGGALLDIWGSPFAIVEAVLSFDTNDWADAVANDARVVEGGDARRLRSLDAVHIAHRIDAGDAFTSADDRAYLDRLGLLNCVDELVSASSALVV